MHKGIAPAASGSFQRDQFLEILDLRTKNFPKKCTFYYLANPILENLKDFQTLVFQQKNILVDTSQKLAMT